MIHAFVPRKKEPETSKPILFSITEVEDILAQTIGMLNETELVRRNDLAIRFVRDGMEAGGVVVVRQEKEMCAVPVVLHRRKKEGN